MSGITRKMEVKMQVLEEKMREMERLMPVLDRQKITAIKRHAEKLEQLLIKVADSI